MTNFPIPDGGGVWTMTDAEFKRELARAWDEGEQAGAMNHAAEECPEVQDITNPYRSQA